jgi:hypothetical protein
VIEVADMLALEHLRDPDRHMRGGKRLTREAAGWARDWVNGK